ncbi:hypothetical protein ACM66B_003337 [Microbotryomycetes sp. NB124-2]
MFGNYLGIGRDKKGNDGPKYSRTQPRATASTRCQKCNKLGHYTYECTGQREYKVRPTRTQILNNPKLRTKVTGQVQALPAPAPATELMPKEGTAAAILAANEAKRQAKAAKLAEQEKKKRRARSDSFSSRSSSSSGSDSDYSSSSSSSGSFSGRNRSRSRSRSRSRERGRGMTTCEAINLKDVEGLPGVSNGRKISASASLVYCSGQIPAVPKDDGTKELLKGSTQDKTRLIIQNLEKVLKAGGSSLGQLVKVNIFITSFDLFKDLNEEYVKLIPDPKPARTCVQVAGLPFGAEIEIEAIGWAES